MTPTTMGVRATQVLLLLAALFLEIKFHLFEWIVGVFVHSNDTGRFWMLAGVLAGIALGSALREAL